jgi:ATP-dependent phosphoenolpyruvate carboxykinase
VIKTQNRPNILKAINEYKAVLRNKVSHLNGRIDFCDKMKNISSRIRQSPIENNLNNKKKRKPAKVKKQKQTPTTRPQSKTDAISFILSIMTK